MTLETGHQISALTDQLLLSATKGDLPGCRYFLDQGADIRACDVNGNTLLMLPAVWACHELLLEILSRGADVVAKNRHGQLALHLAAGSGQGSICLVLLRHGAMVDERNADGMTALHVAAFNGQTQVCDLLVGEGADVNARTPFGYTALSIAASHDDAALCVALCNRGADIDAADDRGRVALSWAVQCRGLETCFALVACGASVFQVRGSNQAFRRALALTKLDAAVEFGDLCLLNKILESDCKSESIVSRVVQAIAKAEAGRPKVASSMRSWLAKRLANEALEM